MIRMNGEFGRQQRVALDAVVHWFKNETRVQPYFKLFGHAGTGKTTMAQAVVQALALQPSEVAYATFMGKAAQVLRAKGCPAAQTLHSLIYLPVAASRAELNAARARLGTVRGTARTALLREIAGLERQLSGSSWILNERSALRDKRLLIVDEVSMVDKRMAEDLLRFRVPVLVLGDPGQLPPFGGEGYFTRQQPDFLLTEVYRQEAGSDVLRLADRVRNGQGWAGDYTHPTNRQARKFDQVIVGTNNERWRRIRQLRQLHGLKKKMPVPGDKVICTKNNREMDIFNGQMFDVVRRVSSTPETLQLVVRDEEGELRTFSVWKQGFRGLAAQRALEQGDWKETQQHAVMTYGWAITCHKAQGSQWRSVLIVDESRAGGWEAKRWMYTAVTRASERVAIMPRSS